MTVQTLAIIVLLVSFFVMIFLRFPIAYAVGLSSVLCLMVQGQALTDVCRLMVKGISSFSLMAVPFFITMGVLMGSGGISEKLIALADACVGWMRGGMAMVNIVASYFFGGISGSASADTASLGSILIPMMVGLMVLSKPLVKLIYERGSFDALGTEMTGTALCFFAVGMIGYGVQTILSRVFYAKQEGKMPLVAGIISIGVNAALCWLLMKPMGLGGLALVAAAWYWTHCPWELYGW